MTGPLKADNPGNRIIRGGDYCSSGFTYPASDRNSDNPTLSENDNGSRSTIYINP